MLQTLVLLLAPFAPHIAEELWAVLGHKKTLAYEDWPKFDPALTVEDQTEVLVQVNSKPCARLTVATGISEEELRKVALHDPKVLEKTNGKTIRKIVVVPGKMVNIVIG